MIKSSTKVDEITLPLLFRDWALERHCEKCFTINWSGSIHYVVIMSTNIIHRADRTYSEHEYIVYAEEDEVTLEYTSELETELYKWGAGDPGMFEKLDNIIKCQCK